MKKSVHINYFFSFGYDFVIFRGKVQRRYQPTPSSVARMTRITFHGYHISTHLYGYPSIYFEYGKDKS